MGFGRRGIEGGRGRGGAEPGGFVVAGALAAAPGGGAVGWITFTFSLILLSRTVMLLQGKSAAKRLAAASRCARPLT
jgi:hypothetical protein